MARNVTTRRGRALPLAVGAAVGAALLVAVGPASAGVDGGGQFGRAGTPSSGARSESPDDRRAGPPLTGKLEMTGDVGDYVRGSVDDPVHDPTVFKDGQTYYVFSTGVLNPDDPGGVYARRSTDTLAGPWESLGEVPLPAWTREYGVNHLWAPHVVEREGVFHLYYAASSFGSNRSAIGLATTRTPGKLDSWIDHGPILTSRRGDDYNAIDPMVFRAGNQWYISFGSFWSGIKLQRLDDMRTPAGSMLSLAKHPVDPPNAIENPQIFQHGRYWYLTVSRDFCCRGVDSTYKTVVGRSLSPTGPFVDKSGTPMVEGGGTVLLDRRGNQVGTGALDVIADRGRLYGVHHYYDADAEGTIRMQIRELEWRDGWPWFSYGPGDGPPPG